MNAYKAAINNVARCIRKQEPDSLDNITAFTASEVLGIAFCKSKEEVMQDILNVPVISD